MVPPPPLLTYPGCRSPGSFMGLKWLTRENRTIGGRAGQFPDVESCRKANVDYTLAAANSFLSALAPQLPAGKKFRFVFCSGKYAEWDQEKTVAFLADSRRIKVFTYCLVFGTDVLYILASCLTPPIGSRREGAV